MFVACDEKGECKHDFFFHFYGEKLCIGICGGGECTACAAGTGGSCLGCGGLEGRLQKSSDAIVSSPISSSYA